MHALAFAPTSSAEAATPARIAVASAAAADRATGIGGAADRAFPGTSEVGEVTPEGGICRGELIPIIGDSKSKLAARPRRVVSRRFSDVARTTPVLHLQSELGQTMAEYAVILTVIAAVILVAIGLLATNLGTHITNLAKLIV
jgi:Flp pilus assembly pilin Flp